MELAILGGVFHKYAAPTALEIRNATIGGCCEANNLGAEAGFAASRFRALDELKQEAVEEQEAVV